MALDKTNEPLDIEDVINKLETDSPVQSDDVDEHAAEQVIAAVEDTGAEETPPTGDDKGQSDPALPAIEPPQSWNATAKDAFSKLPRDLQQVVVDREKEQRSAFDRHSNEAAEARKAAEAERTRLAELTTRQLQGYDELIQSFVATDQVLAEGRTINWPKLAQDDPATYAAKRAAFDDRVQRLNGAIQQRNTLFGQQQQQAAQNYQTWLSQENQKLLDRVPEWKDNPEQARIGAREVIDFAKTKYGISEEELARVADHRAVLMLRDAMLKDKEIDRLKAENSKLSDERKAAAKQLDAKKVVEVPRVAAPKAAPDPERQTSAGAKQLATKARKTGKIHDQVDAVLAALQ